MHRLVIKISSFIYFISIFLWWKYYSTCDRRKTPCSFGYHETRTYKPSAQEAKYFQTIAAVPYVLSKQNWVWTCARQHQSRPLLTLLRSDASVPAPHRERQSRRLSTETPTVPKIVSDGSRRYWRHTLAIVDTGHHQLSVVVRHIGLHEMHVLTLIIGATTFWKLGGPEAQCLIQTP